MLYSLTDSNHAMQPSKQQATISLTILPAACLLDRARQCYASFCHCFLSVLFFSRELLIDCVDAISTHRSEQERETHRIEHAPQRRRLACLTCLLLVKARRASEG
jgi:hypothetical protein